MGRRAEGPKLKLRGGVYWAAFTTPPIPPATQGEEHRFSLGTQDPVEAAKRLAFEYSEALAGRGRARKELKPAARGEIARPAPDVAIAEWIDETIAPSMQATATTYGKHFLAHFESDWSRFADPDQCTRYWEKRLKGGVRRTVQKERRHLVYFLQWAARARYLVAAPMVSPIPRGKKGTRTGKQRERRVEISVADGWRVVARMRETSIKLGGRRWPLRDRYALAWILALRPATMARLEVPRNWRPGQTFLHLEAADEPKAKGGRDIDLSPEAIAILERVEALRVAELAGLEAAGDPMTGPEALLLFGSHRFNKELKRAALPVLGPHLSKCFAAYDFRHGRLQTMVDGGAPLAGAGYQAGHARLTTTDEYVKPNRAAGRAAMAVARAADEAALGHLGEAERRALGADIRTISSQSEVRVVTDGSQPLNIIARPGRFELPTPGSVEQRKGQKPRENPGSSLPGKAQKRGVVIPFPDTVRISAAARDPWSGCDAPRPPACSADPNVLVWGWWSLLASGARP